MRRILALLLLLPLAHADAATVLVPSEYPTIQAGLDASSLGDTVLVAPGTHTDSWNYGAGWTCAFMPDGVVLLSEGGPDVTTIDLAGVGGGASDVFRMQNLPSDLTAIEGFTITGAQVGDGGGVVVNVGRGTVRNCVFRNLDAGASTGGGIALSGTVDVVDCVFEECRASAGGAISHGGNGHLRFLRCTVRSCGSQALSLEGGPSSSALIEDCVFVGNWAATGGAIRISNYGGGALVRRSKFVGNTGATDAGAVAWGNFGSKLIEDCVFLNNGAIGENAEGGAITIGGNGPATIRRNTFYGNYQVDGTHNGATLEILTFVNFSNNIVAGSYGGNALAVAGNLGGGCNVYWENDGIGVPLGSTDHEIDPQFCDAVGGDFTVAEGSPCLEPGSLGCGQIGALGEGCGPVSIEPASWARIKAMFQEQGPRN